MSFFRLTRGLRARYSFLFQLLTTGLIVISIPTLLLSAQNIRNRSEELQRSHQAQCEMTALAVCDQMEHYIESLYGLSYKFHEQASALYGKPDPTVSQELDLLHSIRRLGSGYVFLERAGMYLPNVDDSIIYMDSGKYRLSTFASHVLRSDQERLKERLLAAEPFVMEANADNDLSVYVIPLRFYSIRTPGMALYFLSQSSITYAMKAILPADCRIYSITNPAGDKLFENKLLVQQYDPNGASFDQLTLSDDSYFYVSRKNASGYGCALLIPQSHLVMLTDQYALLSTQYYIVTLILSLLGVGLMCFINYMPLYRLVRSVVGVEHETFNRDEFSILRETYLDHEESYKQVQNRLREERLWLIEHIYDRLLRKMPISQDELRILYQYMPRYTVVCVTIDHSNAPQGLKDYINHLQSPVYVLNSDSTPIFICRIDNDDQTAVQHAMENISRLTGCTEMAASTVSSNLEELNQRYQEAHNALLRIGNERKRAADMQDETWEDQREERNENHLKILDYIEQNFTNPLLSITSLAEELGTSEYTAGRLIRNIYGPNFRRIINEKRLAYAKALLLTSDYPVAEISKMSGFQSASYFIKLFKQTEGITPAQYREKVRQIESEEEKSDLDPREE